jgi:hypothetical protein
MVGQSIEIGGIFIVSGKREGCQESRCNGTVFTGPGRKIWEKRGGLVLRKAPMAGNLGRELTK